MPVDWVDGVTWVNAANLEIMEADIAAKQVSADKGAANGYAPLDASSKVPLVNLPPVSGVDYIGTWGAGVAYKKGDVVTYQGKDYMAVNDSTGVTPPAAANPIPAGASYGISLPSAPFDGQEAILVDSLTNPSYQWRLRYNAGSSSAYKWEFVGGAPLASEKTGIVMDMASTAWVGVAVPSLTVPRAGEYTVRFGCYLQSLASGLYTIEASMAANTPTNVFGITAKNVPAMTYDQKSVAVVNRSQVLGAGTVVGMSMVVQSAISSRLGDGWMEILPRRVS
jgi:Carbohydrate-binding module family 5/12